MNKLLPKELHNLEPISGNRDAFGETVFVKPYNTLQFWEKLKVACDLVRQTMLVCKIPNPNDDVENLIGDSYTACCALVNYLIENGLGNNHKVCFARKSPYESDSAVTTHFIVLVSDDSGQQFQVDPSPYVGYKCGKVEAVSEKWYAEYTVVQGELKTALERIRLCIYEIFSSGGNSYNRIMNRMNYVRTAVEKFGILKGYLFQIHHICNPPRVFKEEKTIELENFEVALPKLEGDLLKLKELKEGKGSIAEQLELMQTISSEKIRHGLEYENMTCIDNEIFKMSELTPRFFYEKKLNLAMIKSSGFFIKKEEQFKEILADRHQVTGDYMANFGESKKYGFSRMNVFHPDGYKYVREMNGPNYVFLIRDEAKEILRRKKDIRNKYSFDLEGRIFKWYDGEYIEWKPIAMNLVHSSDNSAETCCNYQCLRPDRQLMTRFMYPNLKLVY